MTATGTVLGTPRYMPPEQLTGPDIDARADQFSFCVALYEALYGAHPLPGSTRVAMLEKGEDALPPPDGTQVPSSVARAVMRGLAKERAQRFPTMAALVSELTPPPPPARGRTAAVAMVGIIVLGAATAAVMASHTTQAAPTDPNDSETVRVLIDQINTLETQVKQLRKKLLERDLTHDTDLQQLELDKEQLVEKEQRIQELVERGIKLRIGRTAPAVTAQSTKATAAVAGAQHDLEGCFDEWADRPLTAEAVGSGAAAAHRSTDSDVLVTLEVDADGGIAAVVSKGVDVDRSPSLRMCIEGALTRVEYPAGPEILDFEIAVTWAAPNIINTSARVTGHREAVPAP